MILILLRFNFFPYTTLFRSPPRVIEPVNLVDVHLNICDRISIFVSYFAGDNTLGGHRNDQVGYPCACVYVQAVTDQARRASAVALSQVAGMIDRKQIVRGIESLEQELTFVIRRGGERL